MKLKPVDVIAADPEEILVDKVHAVACRDYVKYRDAFDLWWLREKQGQANWADLVRQRYDHHRAMYADSPALAELGDRLVERAREFTLPDRQAAFVEDMRRWLGPDHPYAQHAFACDALQSVASGLADCGRQLAAHKASEPRAKGPKA